MAKNSRRKSSAKSNVPGLTKLADVLPQLIARYGIQQRSRTEEIAAAWKETVGEPYASVTRIVGLNRGQLEIAVPHNAFIQELSFRQAELLDALRTAVTETKIRKLKFVVIDLTQ